MSKKGSGFLTLFLAAGAFHSQSCSTSTAPVVCREEEIHPLSCGTLILRRLHEFNLVQSPRSVDTALFGQAFFLSQRPAIQEKLRLRLVGEQPHQDGFSHFIVPGFRHREPFIVTAFRSNSGQMEHRFAAE